MKLVDVNVWLAAAWAGHPSHEVAKAWVDAQEDDMAFCRVTEMAFLRLLTNPAVTKTDVRTRRQAWDALRLLQADPRIRFVAEPRGLAPLWIALSRRLPTWTSARWTRACTAGTPRCRSSWSANRGPTG
jgi:toxin-antitoxin system PIN domain toxin